MQIPADRNVVGKACAVLNESLSAEQPGAELLIRPCAPFQSIQEDAECSSIPRNASSMLLA